MKRIVTAISLLVLTLATARADIVSTIGLTPISVPSVTVTADFLVNAGLPSQVIFAERQNVTLANPLSTDTGTIAAGTTVDSYFFALNGSLVTVDTSATFSGPILGLVYQDGPDPYGPNPGPFNPNFAASNFLGTVGVVYNFGGSCGGFCGFEVSPSFDMDSASFAGNTAFFHNNYSTPGDFARVLVSPAPVPVPIVGAGLPGLVAALFGLLILGKRRRAA